MAISVLNAPDINSMAPQTFRSITGQDGGLAKGHRYFIRIGPCRLMQAQGGMLNFENDLTYLCEGGEMPGKSFNVIGYRYYGPNKQIPYQVEYNNITLSFIVRNEMRERQYFDNWMELISPSATYNMNYRRDYESNITIYKMVDYDDGIASATYQMTLKEAYPTNMDSIPLAWGDDQYVKLGMTFHYSRWIREGYDQTSAQFELVAGANNQRTGGTVLQNVLEPASYTNNPGQTGFNRPSGRG